jgi:AraC-like DNA-binding protein
MREIFATVCLVGAIQALFLSIVLLIKKNNRRANIYLSFYLIFVTLDLFELYLGSKGLISSARTYQLSIIPYSFIFGPSMFLYIAFLTGRINTFSTKYLLLYLPFVITLVININLLTAFDAAQLPQAVIYMNIIINGVGLFFEAILYVLSFLILHKYISRLKEYFSDIDVLKLSFIRTGLVIMITAVLLIFLTFTNGHVRHEHGIFDIIAILAGLGLVFVIAFFSILQPEIFNRVRFISNAVFDGEEKSYPKYEKFRLPASEEEKYVKNLQTYMSEKKPFLNDELTLQNLADELSISTHHLSMILNIHCKQSFYNFINIYRVEDVKSKLINSEFNDHNILTIAYDSGFNSKSTFNTMFKKFTGKTPKEYRKQLSV